MMVDHHVSGTTLSPTSPLLRFVPRGAPARPALTIVCLRRKGDVKMSAELRRLRRKRLNCSNAIQPGDDEAKPRAKPRPLVPGRVPRSFQLEDRQV